MATVNNANIGFEKQIWDAACVLWGHIPAEELHHHRLDVGPVSYKHCKQCPQVKQDAEKDIVHPINAQVEQILGNGQMAGTGNGQKFRHALDQSQ